MSAIGRPAEEPLVLMSIICRWFVSNTLVNELLSQLHANTCLLFILLLKLILTTEEQNQRRGRTGNNSRAFTVSVRPTVSVRLRSHSSVAQVHPFTRVCSTHTKVTGSSCSSLLYLSLFLNLGQLLSQLPGSENTFVAHNFDLHRLR